jgi:hypothetical protein
MDLHSISKLDPDPHSLQILNSDPHKVNADPKHCRYTSTYGTPALPTFLISQLPVSYKKFHNITTDTA